MARMNTDEREAFWSAAQSAALGEESFATKRRKRTLNTRLSIGTYSNWNAKYNAGFVPMLLMA
jgi:hypothetical protein